MRKKEQYVMSHSELRSLKEEAQMARQSVSIAEKEQYGAGGRGASMDRGAALNQAKKLEELAAKHAASAARGADKDKLAKRAEELRAKLSEGMLSNDEMRDLKRHSDAPLKHLAWERRNGALAMEYKQVMRRLEPDDPGASNLERFRK